MANLKVKKKLATNVKVSAKGKQYKKPFENKNSRETFRCVIIINRTTVATKCNRNKNLS